VKKENATNHFSEIADGYARYRPTYPDRLFSFLALQCAVRSMVWDCGAGSGQASTGLVRHFERVLASDVSLDQISRRTPRPRVDYLVCSAEQPAIATGTIDLVTVAQALHWFHHEEFYAEVRRVLRPGGKLAAWTYGLLSVDEPVDAVIQHLYTELLGSYWPARRQHVDAGYQTIPFPFEEIETPPFHMEWEADYHWLIGYLGTWSAVQAYWKKNRRDVRELVADDLKAAWGEPVDVRQVRWPIHLRVGA
jgi:ubiquinone/menaquinone biosynthesis C-methylase UbiE